MRSCLTLRRQLRCTALCLACLYFFFGDAGKLSTGGEFSSAAAAFRNSVLDDDWEVGLHAAFCLTSGTGFQGSGWVDVPGGIPQLAAAPPQGLPLRFAPIVSKALVLGTGTLHVVSHVTLLVRSLSGKTLVVDGDLGELVSQFSFCLALLTGIPRRHFCLTHQGRVTGEENTFGRQGCGKDALICMRSGLRGGVKPPVVPGSWHCYTCNLGGCWLLRDTRLVVLLLIKHRLPVAIGVSSVKIKFWGGHRNVLLRSNPRTDVRRHLALLRNRPRRGLCRPAPCAGGADAQSVHWTLRGLGLSEDLLRQVAKSLQPPAAKKVSSRERATAPPSRPHRQA